MRLIGRAIAAATAVGVCGFVYAQSRPASPSGGPASYRVSANTYSGMGAGMMGVRPGLGGLLGAVASGRMASEAAAHMLTLELGSNRRPAGAPAAEHVPPAGLKAGPSLPLVSPDPVRPGGVAADSEPGGQPRGRLLMFWGCGERARPGQPFVIDFAQLAGAGASAQMRELARMGRAMGSMGAAVAGGSRALDRGRYATVGEWPNARSRAAVPADGSLVGEHLVRGNYSPDIRFTLQPGQDFLQPFALTGNQPGPGGAVALAWRPIPAALAYSLLAFGGRDDQMVMWTSSELRDGGMPSEFATAAEVQRLVQSRVLLAPQTTQCAVPAEAVQAMGGGGMLTAMAHGPTYAFSYPPRPARAPANWAPDWTALVGTRSTHMAMLGQRPDAGEAEGGGERPRKKRRGLLGIPRPF